jgi:hypothetical protein
MIDKKSIDLVNRDIDGITTPDEHTRLLTLLESNDDLRELHQDLLRLTTTLSGVQAREVPSTLKHSVMHELAKSVHPAPRPSMVEGLFASGRIWWNWQKGLIFAGGVVAGILVFALGSTLFQTRTVNESDLTGTLSVSGSAGDFTDVTTYDIAEGASQGTITASYGRELCLLRVTLRSPGVSQTELLYDAASVRLSAVRPSSDLASRLEIGTGKMTISGRSVEDLVVVFSARTSMQPVVRVKVTGTDGGVFEQMIPVISPKRR